MVRQELGLSQRKLAKLLDVSHTTVQNWEKGTAIPSPMKVDLMKDLLRRARQKKRQGTDPDEWVQTLLTMAAGGLFGAMLAKIYTDLRNPEDEPNEA